MSSAATVHRPSGRVYVVDDDPSVLRAAERLFGSVGLQVAAFASASAFFAGYAPSEIPACLVLDLSMPDLSGLEVQERLLRMGAEIPIVFVSGHGDVSSVAAATRRGAVDFLVKPPDEADLMRAVGSALTRDIETRRRNSS